MVLDGTDGLILDISGCAHLFGGEAGLLADLRSWLGWAMRCEVLDEAVPELSMGPFTQEVLRRLARHPEELGLEPLWPDAAGGHGDVLAWHRRRPEGRARRP